VIGVAVKCRVKKEADSLRSRRDRERKIEPNGVEREVTAGQDADITPGWVLKSRCIEAAPTHL
jgi:hypothetical protein